jgi:hypothetical protein
VKAYTLLLFALVSVAAHAQTTTIRVLVLNGHTGKPISNTGVSVFRDPRIGNGIQNQPSTDAGGVMTITAPIDGQVSATVNQYPTCAHVSKADRGKGRITFSVAEIISTGVVRRNDCSKRTAPPHPGELTLFVRPLNLWERLSN